MPIITLIDGSKYNFKNSSSLFKILKNINSNLLKSFIAGYINEKIIDSEYFIKNNSKLIIINNKNNEGLKIIRNSCVYLLGYAIKKLWPSAKMLSGKITDQGFYYDVDINYIIKKNDLILLENLMYKFINKNYKIIKKQVSWEEICNIFNKRKEDYKLYIIKKFLKNYEYYTLSFHKEYIDIYNGPQIFNKNLSYYFTLNKITNTYWKIHNKKKILQRIYGTTFYNKKHLILNIKKIKEINKRDHRKIGKQLKLYHIQKNIPGMVFWHNDGWILFRKLKSFIRKKLKDYQYQEVKGPSIIDRKLWEKTGHWENYSEYMFTTSSEKKEYCIKPMSCPGHVQIFNQGLKSYKDLPIRISEFGSCYRNEPSGALHGLMRVRGFTQDDAHIFCTEDQILNEVNNCIKMIYEVYNIFGFKTIFVKLSTQPKKYIGNNDIWKKAENDLSFILNKNKIIFEYQPGKGAFYGPKIEFTLSDCLGRSWQCGTIQLDFSLPERLNAFYIGKNNKRIVPVMIHRAILGSIERFIGILTEEYAGFYPIWLAPTQVVVLNINNNNLKYSKIITEKIFQQNIRVKTDFRNEKIGFKIREHTINKVPYILICGDKEINTKTVYVRTRYGKKLGNISINKIISKIKKEIYSYNNDK